MTPTRYVPHSAGDVEEMLAAVRASSVDDLFAEIPEEVRRREPLALPAGLSELEVVAELRRLAGKDVPATQLVSFLGAGVYDHYVPAVVDAVVSRGEFLTAYTPYQPERSQGVLQTIFEFQTAICELTGMDVQQRLHVRRRHGAGRGLVPRRRADPPRRGRPLGRRAPGVPAGARHGVGRVRAAPADRRSAGGRGDRPGGACRRRQRRHGGRRRAAAQLLRRARRPARRCRARPRGRALCWWWSSTRSRWACSRRPAACADIVVGEAQALGNAMDFGGPDLGSWP